MPDLHRRRFILDRNGVVHDLKWPAAPHVSTGGSHAMTACDEWLENVLSDKEENVTCLGCLGSCRIDLHQRLDPHAVWLAL